MNILVRESREDDKKEITRFIYDLGEYIMGIDPLGRVHEMPNQGVPYTEEMINKVSNNEGEIYVAEIEGRTVGFVAGIIEEYDSNDISGYGPFKEGRVIELYVDEESRGKKAGQVLITKMEDYFREKQCDLIRIGVFKTNENAQKFYSKLNYSERNIEIVKKI